jgi:hypothetical protein
VEDANLYVIDPATGEATNEITLNDGESAILCCGLTFKPDGTMLVHEYSNRTGSWTHKLYSGDPTTGMLTFMTDITGVSGLYGIEYANGVLYGCYDNHLYSIDMTTGAATLIGTGSSAWDLSFGGDGVMRGTGPGPEDGAIYAINLTNGSATLIKDFKTDLNQVAVGLEVVCSPVITGQPAGQMVHAGQIASISVTVNGTEKLNYQWQKQNNSNVWEAIDGATAYQYILDPFANGYAGGYRCVITNLAGSVISNRVMLNAGDANRDGWVDVGDLGILSAHYGQSGMAWLQADFNGDGSVDVGDLGILSAHYGFGPEN